MAAYLPVTVHRRYLPVREPRGEEAALQALECAEGMVSACAESAKLYRRWWGPLGEPMTYSVGAWLSCSMVCVSSS